MHIRRYTVTQMAYNVRRHQKNNDFSDDDDPE